MAIEGEQLNICIIAQSTDYSCFQISVWRELWSSHMWCIQQISCCRCRDFQPPGQSSLISSFSLWAACLLFAISTPVMLSTVRCSSHSRLVKPNPAWPQTEWRAGRRGEHLCNFTLLLAVWLTPAFSPFLSISFFLLLKHNLKSVCEHVSICVLCVCSNNCEDVSAVARVTVWLCWEVAKSAKKETSKAPSWKVKNCESHCVRNTPSLLLLSTLWTSRETQQERREEAP